MNIPSILHYAFRYALGRMTLAPSEVSDAIKENIKLFTDYELNLIIKEIYDADDEGRIGMNIDRETWYDLVGFIEESRCDN